jgi:hypothetical protein
MTLIDISTNALDGAQDSLLAYFTLLYQLLFLSNVFWMNVAGELVWIRVNGKLNVDYSHLIHLT